MGRALFSLAYAEPAVRTEPEPEVEPYGRWSTWNSFDPDSDDFFRDAEYEAFIDPVHIQRQHAPVPTLEPSTDSERTADSSDSGDSSDGDQPSPVVSGSEIPVVLGGRFYNNRPLTYTPSPRLQWMERSSSPASYVSSSTSHLPVLHSPVSPQSPDLLDNPPFIPPPSFRQPTPDIERESSLPIDPPPSPPLRRSVNITPINVSRIQIMPATRSPSPDSPPVPATPPSQMTPLGRHTQSQAMLTPSPPPSVTPRFYSWQNHPIPALPTSPTIIRGNVHSTFRRSTSSRVHIPSAVV